MNWWIARWPAKPNRRNQERVNAIAVYPAGYFSCGPFPDGVLRWQTVQVVNVSLKP